MKVLFTGGGTLGPVTPLLAIAEVWRAQERDLELTWVGTSDGPEKQLVKDEKLGAKFYSLPKARLTRYPSGEWVALPFQLFAAFSLALRILLIRRPDVIISAGGYTSVPVILAAVLLRIPRIVHQQDVDPLLTNKLVKRFASAMTVSWKETLPFFEKEGAQLIGNPVRTSVTKGTKSAAVDAFGLNKRKPTVLVFGGGTGAGWINEQMEEIGAELKQQANVIHVTGKGKLSRSLKKIGGNYYVTELLTNTFKDAYAAADVVVCRAGLGTITELAALKKAEIMIPLQKSPQESNVRALGSAVVTLTEENTSSDKLLREIERLVKDKERRTRLGDRIHGTIRTDSASAFIALAKQYAQT